ncbi:MAG TPA: cellulase family glycosylhydrolase, partial [Chloroflexota bacterium]
EPGFGPEILTGLWYTNQYPESAWQADWIRLATRFRHDSAFVGADLRNEPHITGSVFDMKSYFKLGPLWGAFNNVYYHDRDWHYAAQTLGNELLKINPNLLIVVEGVQMYYDPFMKSLTGALWGSNLIGVQYDPIVLDRPSQLVYSVHEYGPKMWPGDWFNAGTSYQQLSDRWTNLWGYLLTAPKFMQAPILVGEFGTCDDWYVCVHDPTHPARQGFWFQSFVRYMQSHPQVGWAYWALNPDGPFQPDQRDYYSLMTYDWHHYYPLIPYGLAPLLKEPNG